MQCVSPRGVIGNMMDSTVVVSAFEFYFRIYLYFRTNAFGKGMNHSYGLNSTATVLQ